MNQARTGEKRPRVCIVRHSFYPFELNVKREAEALVREGYDVAVICLRGADERSRETVNGVAVHRMPLGHKRGKILRYLFEYNAFFILASVRLLGMHLARRLEFVQVNTMPDYLVFVALAPKLLGAKVILHMHEPMPELFRTMFPASSARPLIKAIELSEKISLRFADRVLTVTREMRENFGGRGAKVSKITVVVNVPDDETFRLDRHRDAVEALADLKREERRRGVFRLVTHGAIEERYGPDLVVGAMAALREKLPNLEFHILGKGDHLDRLLDLARELKVADRVRYKGFLALDEMIRELLAADVGLVPMLRNPYSMLVHTNKMYEYVALGKPVIASRLASVVSYFPEDTLVYFEPGDGADLAEKIHWVFSHPEEVHERVLKATEVYETYRWERERRKYLGVYEGLRQDR